MSIKCADCGCDPQDCKRRECPHCTLEVCCCLPSSSTNNLEK